MKDYPWFPMFVDLSDRRALVVGAGRIAARRAETLVRFTPNVTVVAPRVCLDVEALAAAGRVRLLRRAFEAADLDGADIVVAATDDGALNGRIAALCREMRIPVNDASDKGLCDFYFPGVALRGGIVAGVTASGKDHAAAKRATEAVRRALEDNEGKAVEPMKKALIVVSFGTTHEDAAREGIAPVEDALRRAFSDREVRRAWTARFINRVMARRGTPVENEEEAVESLRREGCEDIALAATHIIPGEEYARVCAAAGALPVSEPLLANGDDLRWMAALLGRIADEAGTTLLAMGHGTEHAADETYARLRALLPGNVKLACVEGRHSLDGLLDELDALPEKKLTLMPLMLVAGDHAANDLAGDAPDSWKSRLEARGFDIRLRLKGLGALPEVQQRYVEKVGEALGIRH